MELISWWTMLLAACELGVSWLIKKYSALNPKVLPWINFGGATVIFYITCLQAGVDWIAAIPTALYRGFVVAAGVTGVHSWAKNGVVELIRGTAPATPTT